jgi:hypothetical protein
MFRKSSKDGLIGWWHKLYNDFTQVSTNTTLKWTKFGSKSTSKVSFGKNNPPPEVATENGYSYQPGTLEERNVCYWRINDGKLWKFRTGY